MALHELNQIDPKRSRDILALLTSELSFLEEGGYGPSEAKPSQSSSIFLDSPTCLNFNKIWTPRCAECLLLHFVPLEYRSEPLPCHHIPLNEAGETVKSIRQGGNQEKLQGAVKSWLRSNIRRLEEMTSGERSVPKTG